MAMQPVRRMTPEEYLAFERVAETRHEFVDGMIVPRGGSARSHNLIRGNLIGLLYDYSWAHDYEMFTAMMRIHIPESAFFAYPDLVVVRGKAEVEDAHNDTLLYPITIIEVVAHNLEAYTRGLKSACYRRSATLQDYLLVAEDRHSIERYSRGERGWMFTEFTEPTDIVELPSLGCTLRLSEVYKRIEFLSEPAWVSRLRADHYRELEHMGRG